MEASGPAPQLKVYRVRNLPGNVDRLAAASLIAQSMDGIQTDDVVLSSLALTIDPWTPSSTKTATVSFKKTPSPIASRPGGPEWRLPGLGSQSPLIVDTHFRGFTPLNDVHSSTHEHEWVLSYVDLIIHSK